MGNNRYYFVLQLCLYLWIPVYQAECPYKECSCSESQVTCTDLQLQVFPHLVSVNTSLQWTLAIDGNNISRIPAESLPPNVINVYLNGNPITTIDDNAFDESATTLTAMYFANVRFSRFPDAFGHLRALNYLSITGANITDWNENAWVNIGQTLKILELANVGMTEWPSFTRHCTQLTSLNIIWNNFSSIPDGALDSVANSLNSLALNNNRLTIVPKALTNLNFLQILNLQNNHITDVSWLPKHSKLEILSLSYNYIWNATQLSEVLRNFNSTLSTLDIDNNQLTSIPEIAYMNDITALELIHNKISDYISGSVPSRVFILGLSYNSFPLVPKILSKLMRITDIDLSYNAIRSIQETDFHNETNSLDLGFNLVTELTDTSFPENFRLQDLELNNNPLIRISSVALQHLPNLRYLNLEYTEITRLPLGLSYLRSLDSLNLSNIPMLVCTCMESELTAWVVKINRLSVLGNCGQTSVYDFFYILSPSCPSPTAPLSQ